MIKTEKIQLTPQGLKDLENELEYRKTVKKKELSEALGEATAKGDLSENDEYNIVLEETLTNDSRISELTETLKNVEIIKGKKSTSSVSIGHTVTVKNENGKEMVFTMVGATESNPMEQKISNTSPIGKSLMGKSVNTTVEVKTPKGMTKYTILKIE